MSVCDRGCSCSGGLPYPPPSLRLALSFSGSHPTCCWSSSCFHQPSEYRSWNLDMCDSVIYCFFVCLFKRGFWELKLRSPCWLHKEILRGFLSGMCINCVHRPEDNSRVCSSMWVPTHGSSRRAVQTTPLR